jgi:hypothetical protein
MIAAARRRLGETDAVAFHLGRFEDVDLAEQAFDAVLRDRVPLGRPKGRVGEGGLAP